MTVSCTYPFNWSDLIIFDRETIPLTGRTSVVFAKFLFKVEKNDVKSSYFNWLSVS